MTSGRWRRLLKGAGPLECFLFVVFVAASLSLMAVAAVVLLPLYLIRRGSGSTTHETPIESRSSVRPTQDERGCKKKPQSQNLSHGGGGFNVSVVGESHHQHSLRDLLGANFRSPDEYVNFDAFLVPEPDNRYDPNAVAVCSADLKVLGYLSRSDAQRYGKVFRALRESQQVGRVRASLIGGTRKKPSIGVVLDLDEDAEGLLERIIGSSESVLKAMEGDLGGRTYTTFVGAVKAFKRKGDLASAERLLLNLLPAIEAEAKGDGIAPAPWYYEQLAIIYGKQKRYEDQVAVLERVCGFPGAQPRLQDRLDKARKVLAGKGVGKQNESLTEEQF
jgi:hypothetical protein